MKAYIIRRLLHLVPVLFLVTLIIFTILYIAPGDPATVMLGDTATPDQIARLRVEMGLDAPLHKQYLRWIGGVLKGDLGHSYFLRQSVSEAILSRIGPTTALAIYSTTLAISLGILLGILAAVNRGTVVDQTSLVLSLLGVSTPNFLLGMLFVLLFAVKLRWFPVAGYQPLSKGFLVHIKSLTLPAVSIAVMMIAVVARMTRSAMLETLYADFIKTARAKGLKEKYVIFRHAFRNAFLPVLTVIGRLVAGSLVGAVVVETIYNLPGLGQLLMNAISRRDYFVVQGIVLFIVFINVFFNLLVDLLYAVVDPRVRLDKK
ncbi:MAG TPA: ABC transporter permease [Firmicutes bacterium]|nr:ABC transporter permease [Bacillota bacterium]